MFIDFSKDRFVSISSVTRSGTSLITYQSIRCNISEDLRDRLRLWDILKYQFLQNTSNAGSLTYVLFVI